jgi:hypothetical protein
MVRCGVRLTREPKTVFHPSDRRVLRVLHIALGLLLAIQGAINLFLCVVNARGLQLIAFHAVEVAGALLFIWSRTIVTGAWVLVGAYLAAAVVHALDRNPPFEHLVYAIAVLIVLAQVRTASRPEHSAA